MHKNLKDFELYLMSVESRLVHFLWIDWINGSTMFDSVCLSNCLNEEIHLNPDREDK